ncbi:MAG: DUF1566 domain-containing protein, partial [Gammaproteobacteria bacterium]|nr:DUF1566 domain-containing protein [Gammaproteobacteria bacterium]
VKVDDLDSNSSQHYTIDNRNFHVKQETPILRFVIIDNDDPPKITINSETNGEITESQGILPIKISLHNSATDRNSTIPKEGGISYPIVIPCEVSGPNPVDLDIISPCPITVPGNTSDSYTVNFLIRDDALVENDEDWKITFGEAKSLDPADKFVSPITLEYSDTLANSVSFTISDTDDTHEQAVPDTGINDSHCIVDIGDPPAICDETNFPGQDQSTNEVSKQPSHSTQTDSDCISDLITGLMWEKKSNDANSYRYNDHRFNWYETNQAINGGVEGIVGNGNNGSGNAGDEQPKCLNAIVSTCDTKTYLEAANSQGLCGFSDWRLPKLHELLTIVNYGKPTTDTTPRVFDTNFANMKTVYPYWTASTVAGMEDLVWAVDFDASTNKRVGTIHIPRNHTLRLSKEGVPAYIILVRTVKE